MESLLVALTSLALTWFIGNGIAIQWAIRQKRRELELSMIEQLYSLYGEFFALMKLWNYLKGGSSSGRVTVQSETPGTTRWELLQKASLAEGKVESLFVKLSAERNLDKGDLEDLGLFRQAYQILRESIEADTPIEWGESGHPEYAEFKRLITNVAHLVGKESQSSWWLFNLKDERPSAKQASEAFRGITSNKWEDEWERRVEQGIKQL